MATKEEVINYVKKCIGNSNLAKHGVSNLIKIRDAASKAYFNDEDEILPDYLFDQLVELLESMGHPRTIGASVSTTNKPGYSNQLTNKHWFGEFLGGLNKATSIDALNKFLKKLEPSTFATSEKIDGHSLAITFTPYNGQVVDATTRGEGGIGKDLLYLFQDTVKFGLRTPNDSYKFKPDDKIVLKVEAAVTWHDLELLNNSLKNKSYASCRSAVGAIMGAEDGAKLLEFLTIVVHQAKFFLTDKQLSNQYNSNFIRSNEYLKYNLSISSKVKLQFNPQFTGSRKETIKYIEEYNRFESAFQNDGIVVVALDKAEEWVGNCPTNSIAYKFPPAEALTKVTGMRYDFGKSGRITPVVQFEPVIINGHEYTNTSIASYKRFKALKAQGLGIGTTIKFTLRHDVLGYVDVFDASTKTAEVEFPQYCEHCNSPLLENSTGNLISCCNLDCDGNIVGKAVSFVKELKIKGIKEATMESLLEAGVYTGLIDFIKMYKYISNMSSSSVLADKIIKANVGFKDKSVDNLFAAIENMFERTITDAELFAAFSVPGLRHDRFSAVFRAVDFSPVRDAVIKTDKKLFKEEIINFIGRLQTTKIDSVGTVLIESISNWITKNLNTIYQFCLIYSHNLKITYGASLEFSNLTVCITGSCIAMPRKIITEKLKELGVTVAGSVSKKTNYLITDDAHTGSSKAVAAIQNNTPIITSAKALEIFKLN